MEIEYRLPFVIHIDITKYNTICRKKMWQWCKTTFGNYREIWSWESQSNLVDTFYFKDENHANMFILRWG